MNLNCFASGRPPYSRGDNCRTLLDGRVGELDQAVVLANQSDD